MPGSSPRVVRVVSVSVRCVSDTPSHRVPRKLTLHVGKEELVIRRRYEAASILNDVLIAVWFLVGSVMFFSPEWTRTGTWCFVLGSVELMIRPTIRLSKHVHIQRLRGDGSAWYSESSTMGDLPSSSDDDY